MIKVTVTAIEQLKKISINKRLKPEATIRVVASSKKPHWFEFIWDEENEDDILIKSGEGITLLCIKPDLASEIEGMVIDYHYSEIGDGFIISPLLTIPDKN